MRGILLTAAALALTATLSACRRPAPTVPDAGRSPPVATTAVVPAAVPPAGEPPADFHPECDAGDEAWVRKAVPFLLGRPPFGTREVRVLTDLTGTLGRE